MIRDESAVVSRVWIKIVLIMYIMKPIGNPARLYFV